MSFRAWPGLALSITVSLTVSLAPTSAVAARIHRSPTGGHAKSAHHSSKPAKSHRMHGQQSIAPDRATVIQQALIREHYLTGEPSGHWDDSTLAAMTKFQADNGWQTKLAPDSRALIKLGLGPNHSGAMNASAPGAATGASTGYNQLPKPDSAVDQNQGFIAASGIRH